MIRKLGQIQTIIAGDGTHLKEVLHPGKEKVELPYSLAYAFLEAGQSSMPHSLAQTEVYHIIQGTGLAVVDGKENSIGQGDTFVVPPKALQFLINTGDGRLAFLCIVSPPWSAEGEEIFP